MWALGVLIVAQAATSTSGAWTERFAGSRAGLEVSTTVAGLFAATTVLTALWLALGWRLRAPGRASGQPK